MEYEANQKRQHVNIVAATFIHPVAAAAMLIFTKSTRLEMSPGGLEEVKQKCFAEPEWMMQELDYMSKTIRSSWEFLDITFAVRNVSRACAQQMTRTRFTPIDGDLFASYAMQSQRVTDMSGMGWHNPFDAEEQQDRFEEFEARMQDIVHGHYEIMVNDGVKLEDARGVLPVNLHCNLIAKYNLRMLVDLVQKRESYRAQGEFNTVAREMREALVEMWPWASLFLRPKNDLAKSAVQDLRVSIEKAADQVGQKLAHEMMIKLAKVDDILQGD
jgi:flavin-dependent thymidylate synthase